MSRGGRARSARRCSIRSTATPRRPDPRDDSLTLFLLCCHPALPRPAQLALTLRAVGGLTTAEIARGLLEPEATVAQRISRAKARIRAEGARFRMPSADELPDRVAAVCQVLHLMFTEAHTASAGESLARADLSAEAIRLTRMLRARRRRTRGGAARSTGCSRSCCSPSRGVPARLRGDAGRPARARAARRAGPSRWDRALIDEGAALVEGALATAARALPVAGGDRRAARRGALDRRHRLAAGPGAVRAAAPLGRPGPDGRAGLGGRDRDGARAGCRAARARGRRARTGARRHFRVHAVRGHLLALAGRDATRAPSSRPRRGSR